MSCCPLCNGLSEIYLSCPNCSEILEDTGMIENFFDPYSPYLGEEILDLNDGVGKNQCLHLFSCPNCGYDCQCVINHVSNDAAIN
jgi:transcription elongation factor Elf1